MNALLAANLWEKSYKFLKTRLEHHVSDNTRSRIINRFVSSKMQWLCVILVKIFRFPQLAQWVLKKKDFLIENYSFILAKKIYGRLSNAIFIIWRNSNIFVSILITMNYYSNNPTICCSSSGSLFRPITYFIIWEFLWMIY